MFPYIGGKSHHIKWLDPLFPKQYTTFVEVFGGAGWVSWKSNSVEISTTRVYNDYNPLLANVFWCFSKSPVELLTLMNSTPRSDLSRFLAYQKELFVDLDWSSIVMGDVDLAMKYLYLQTQIFAGTTLGAKSHPYFTELKAGGKYASKYETLKKKLNNPKIVSRLQSISTVESMDCIDVIKKYDSPTTFFYIDPPYYNKEFYYSKDFPREKHQELAQTLDGISGKFALSYYDFDDLHNFYPETRFKWHIQSVYKSAATRAATLLDDEDYKTVSRGSEILIMNYGVSNESTNPLSKLFTIE